MINSSVVLYLCIAGIIFLNNADGRNLDVAGTENNVSPTHHFAKLLCSGSREGTHPADICMRVWNGKASALAPTGGDYCAKNITCDHIDGKHRVLQQKPLDRTPCDWKDATFACLGGLCVPAADKNFSNDCALSSPE